MNEVMQKLDDNDPLMIAWKAYQASAEYANTSRWAKHIQIDAVDADGLLNIKHPHVEGSLWAAFMTGYRAAQSEGEKRE
jgi:hypothetical protein